ncbi:helix-turn-helix domain-containing protein [Streptomyces sp. NPDC038707]|uniref:helix-turn-helix domain-containing protein n=1 Tax=Streptomyces sp. NPDC038707 TaxID=3154329 RepID=UPI0033C50397
MPPKRKINLPDHVRAAVLADIALTHESAVRAEENDKIRIFLATEQGLDTYEIADELGDVSQQTVSRWARQGKEILERREREKREREQGSNPAGEDPVRPRERQPIG